MLADILAAASLNAFLLSAACSALIVAFGRRLAQAFDWRSDLTELQAVHDTPTPRLGGVGVLLAIGLGAIDWFGDAVVQANYWLFIVSHAPVAAAGLIEDTFGSVRPRWRLLAAELSGILLVAIFGQWLPRVGVPGVDWAMAAWPILAIGFTIFACTGVTHAVNLIDGVHGLCGMWAVAASLCLAMVAQQAGLDAHVQALMLFCCAVLGFLAVNYPMGKIFLGDAGAYTVGHALAWIAVSIVWLSADVAPFALLLIFLWPVVDTLYAIARRLTNGRPIFAADAEHIHHIIYRMLHHGGLPRGVANPLSAIVLLPAYLGPMVAGICFWDDNATSAVVCLLFGGLFVVTVSGLTVWKKSKSGDRA